MEIERKYLISHENIPNNLETYCFHQIEQGYLNRDPVVRVRRQDDEYYLTYKSSGLMAREEYNLPLNENGYNNLIKKADGRIITKKRFIIPFNKYIIELDVFEGEHKGLVMAEVEFESEEEANEFQPPVWFGEDVTFSGEYHNSNLSR